LEIRETKTYKGKYDLFKPENLGSYNEPVIATQKKSIQRQMRWSFYVHEQQQHHQLPKRTIITTLIIHKSWNIISFPQKFQ
jgi:hypothetical protein